MSSSITPNQREILAGKNTISGSPEYITSTGGKLNVNATVSITGVATADNQTNGLQLTQIVDAGGEAATVTGGKLDVNASFSPSGTQDINISEVGGNVVTDTIPTSFKDTVVTGTLTTVGDVVQVSTANGYNCVGVTVTGSFGGATIIPEVSGDGVRFDGCTFFTVAGSTPLTSTAAVGTYQSLVGGMQTFQVRLSTLASGGPISITLRASRALTSVMLDNGLPTGSNTIGNVGINNGSNNIGKVNMLDSTGDLLDSSSQALWINPRDSSGVEIPPLTNTQLRASAVPVSLATAPTTPVTGTFWQTTQPVSGTFFQSTQPVSLAATVVTQETQPTTPTLTNVTMTGSSITLLALNSSRRVATIFNDSGVTVYVKFGSAASSTSFTIKMVDQSYYEVPNPVYTGIITALGASGVVRVTEIV